MNTPTDSAQCCAVCGNPAPIQVHFALPEIARTPFGYRNLVVCTLACREVWRAQRAERDAEVNTMQQSDAAALSLARSRKLTRLAPAAR